MKCISSKWEGRKVESNVIESMARKVEMKNWKIGITRSAAGNGIRLLSARDGSNNFSPFRRWWRRSQIREQPDRLRRTKAAPRSANGGNWEAAWYGTVSFLIIYIIIIIIHLPNNWLTRTENRTSFLPYFRGSTMIFSNRVSFLWDRILTAVFNERNEWK